MIGQKQKGNPPATGGGGLRAGDGGGVRLRGTSLPILGQLADVVELEWGEIKQALGGSPLKVHRHRFTPPAGARPQPFKDYTQFMDNCPVGRNNLRCSQKFDGVRAELTHNEDHPLFFVGCVDTKCGFAKHSFDFNSSFCSSVVSYNFHFVGELVAKYKGVELGPGWVKIALEFMMANPVGSMFGVRDAKGDVSKEKRVLYEDGLYLEFMVFNIIHIGPSGLETVHGGCIDHLDKYAIIERFVKDKPAFVKPMSIDLIDVLIDPSTNTKVFVSKVDGVPRSARDLSIFLLDLASRGGNPVVDPFVGDGAAPAGYSPFEGYVLSVNGLDCEDGPVKRRQSVSHMDKGGVSRTLLEVKVKREHKVRNLLVFVFQLDAGHRRVAFFVSKENNSHVCGGEIENNLLHSGALEVIRTHKISPACNLKVAVVKNSTQRVACCQKYLNSLPECDVHANAVMSFNAIFDDLICQFDGSILGSGMNPIDSFTAPVASGTVIGSLNEVFFKNPHSEMKLKAQNLLIGEIDRSFEGKNTPGERFIRIDCRDNDLSIVRDRDRDVNPEDRNASLDVSDGGVGNILDLSAVAAGDVEGDVEGDVGATPAALVADRGRGPGRAPKVASVRCVSPKGRSLSADSPPVNRRLIPREPTSPGRVVPDDLVQANPDQPVRLHEVVKMPCPVGVVPLEEILPRCFDEKFNESYYDLRNRTRANIFKGMKAFFPMETGEYAVDNEGKVKIKHVSKSDRSFIIGQFEGHGGIAYDHRIKLALCVMKGKIDGRLLTAEELKTRYPPKFTGALFMVVDYEYILRCIDDGKILPGKDFRTGRNFMIYDVRDVLNRNQHKASVEEYTRIHGVAPVLPDLPELEAEIRVPSAPQNQGKRHARFSGLFAGSVTDSSVSSFPDHTPRPLGLSETRLKDRVASIVNNLVSPSVDGCGGDGGGGDQRPSDVAPRGKVFRSGVLYKSPEASLLAVVGHGVQTDRLMAAGGDDVPGGAGHSPRGVDPSLAWVYSVDDYPPYYSMLPLVGDMQSDGLFSKYRDHVLVNLEEEWTLIRKLRSINPSSPDAEDVRARILEIRRLVSRYFHQKKHYRFLRMFNGFKPRELNLALSASGPRRPSPPRASVDDAASPDDEDILRLADEFYLGEVPEPFYYDLFGAKHADQVDVIFRDKIARLGLIRREFNLFKSMQGDRGLWTDDRNKTLREMRLKNQQFFMNDLLFRAFVLERMVECGMIGETDARHREQLFLTEVNIGKTVHTLPSWHNPRVVRDLKGARFPADFKHNSLLRGERVAWECLMNGLFTGEDLECCYQLRSQIFGGLVVGSEYAEWPADPYAAHLNPDEDLPEYFPPQIRKRPNVEFSDGDFQAMDMEDPEGQSFNQGTYNLQCCALSRHDKMRKNPLKSTGEEILYLAELVYRIDRRREGYIRRLLSGSSDHDAALNATFEGVSRIADIDSPRPPGARGGNDTEEDSIDRSGGYGLGGDGLETEDDSFSAGATAPVAGNPAGGSPAVAVVSGLEPAPAPVVSVTASGAEAGSEIVPDSQPDSEASLDSADKVPSPMKRTAAGPPSALIVEPLVVQSASGGPKLTLVYNPSDSTRDLTDAERGLLCDIMDLLCYTIVCCNWCVVIWRLRCSGDRSSEMHKDVSSYIGYSLSRMRSRIVQIRQAFGEDGIGHLKQFIDLSLFFQEGLDGALTLKERFVIIPESISSLMPGFQFDVAAVTEGAEAEVFQRAYADFRRTVEAKGVWFESFFVGFVRLFKDHKLL